MTTKEKYELFDKTKINEKVLGILKNMQESSKNFTDESVNSKIDSALDKLIENFRANKPEALLTLPEAKKEVKKEKEKAIKKNEGKDLSDKKDTDDKTGLPKKDTLEERKDIIKEESETEKEARDRAKKELEKEKEKAKDEVESQIEKLNRLILEDPALRGFNTGSAATGGGRSTPIIDAERKALPRGSRVSQKGWQNQYGASKGGRKYWENRENRSDRKSPEYETGKPYLAKGGNVYSSDELYIVKVYDGKTNELLDMSKRVWARNLQKAKEEAIDNYEYDMKQQYGDDLRFKVEEAPSMFADGGEVKKDWYDIRSYSIGEYGEDGAKKMGNEYIDQHIEYYKGEVKKDDLKIRKSPYGGQDFKGEYVVMKLLPKFATGGMMADGGMVNRKELNKKIKDYYIKTYPTDKEGKEINDKITFKRFWAYLSQGYDVYEVLEVADSLIRERVFEKLSEIYAVDYDVVYNMWLRSDKYAKGGEMADGGEIKNLIGKEFRPFTATSNNEYNVKIVQIDFDNVTYKHKDGQVKKSKTSDFLDSYIQVKNEDGYMANGGELNGNLYRVGYLKVYENDEEGDIVYTREIYGDSEEDVSSKFKKIHPKHKIQFISKYADGGIRLRHKYSFVYEPMLYTFTVELNNSEDELFEFETMEQSFRFARVEEKEGNRITDVSKYKKIGFQRYEREQELLDKYKEWTPSIVDEIKINKSRGYRYADGGMMADGGEVDFNERMAKMRNAYENLNMIVKSRIAVAVGIDRAISIMERDYSIDPFGLITSAVRGGLLELDEINKDLVNEAVYEAERVTDDYRDSGQGIGGSDMTYFTKSVLDGVGYKTGFVNNRLTRVDADGNELVIDKYEMNY